MVGGLGALVDARPLHEFGERIEVFTAPWS